MERKHKEESKNFAIQERARLEKEAIERGQRDAQKEMNAIKEQMKQQKEEAFRLMDEDRRNRERRELLRREHEASLNKPRAVVKKQQPVAPPPKKKIAPSARIGLPFEPEDDVDQELLNEYQNRAEPDQKLPKVILSKRNGYYWIGQRRFEVELQDQLYVREGVSHLTLFSTWIEKAERVEGLRQKGYQSAQTLFFQQSALQHSHHPVY